MKRVIDRRRFQISLCAMAASVAGSVAAQSGSRELVIGQVASLSGSNGADLGQGLKLGVEAAFARANAGGGVSGRPVRLVSLDDQYLPDETVRHTRALIEQHKPVALVGYRGTANALALIKSETLTQANVPLIGVLSGAAEIQGAPMIYHVRTSYPEEVAQLVRQLSRLGMTRLGLFHVDDAFGLSGREAVRKAVTAAQSSLVVEAAYDKAPERVQASVEAAVDALVAKQPQAIVMVAVGEPVYRFVKVAKAKSPTIRLFSMSVVSPAAVIEKAGIDAARGMGFSQVFPFPFSDANPLAREYRAALKAHASDASPGYFSLEGYVYARVLLDALRRAGRDPGPAQVRRALDTAPPLDLGGFNVAFDSKTRNGSRFSDLAVIATDGKLMR